MPSLAMRKFSFKYIKSKETIPKEPEYENEVYSTWNRRSLYMARSQIKFLKNYPNIPYILESNPHLAFETFLSEKS
jgi:hypothetical protein